MKEFATKFVKSYFSYGVSRSSACLAYYLMFSFFPLVLFLNSVLGLIDINPQDIEMFLDFIPDDVVYLINYYLQYLSQSNNIMPLFLGLFFIIYSFTRYVNSLYHIINNIYGYTKPRLSMLKSFFFTISMMVSVYLTLFLFVIGGEIFNFILKFIVIPSEILNYIVMVRFLVPVLYFFMVIVLIYRFIPVEKVKFKNVLPGAVFAMFALFILSIGFSIYVSRSSNYSIIYGSLSAMMFLMMWLYFSSMVIVQGSVLNKILQDNKNI